MTQPPLGDPQELWYSQPHMASPLSSRRLQKWLLGLVLSVVFSWGLWLMKSDPKLAALLAPSSPTPRTTTQQSPRSSSPIVTNSSPSAVLGTETVLETATVVKVVDGDTIQLSDGRHLRYIGMDTPETHHPTKGVECFGEQAAAKNKELVEGKTIQLEKDVSETDRYGRLLRYVWLDGQLVNEQLVRAGFAFARSYPPDIAKQAIFRAAEADARDNQRGLWQGCQVTNGHTQQVAVP